ncbi:MAG: SDR family NAD(P)-dependent oxidoreductase, partial [Microbacterium sp.]
MWDLAGQVAIITGGAQGIGLGIARAFVREGVAVVLTDIDAEALETAGDSLGQLVEGARTLTIVSDAKDHDGAAAVVAATLEEFGRLDILVNNAQQFIPSLPIEEHTWQHFVDAYESGVFATWRYMTAAFEALKATKGTVINMGSGAGVMAQPQQAAYGSN